MSDSVQALAPPAEDFAIDMGDVPSIDGVDRAAPRRRARRAAAGTTRPGSWARVLVAVIGVFMMLKPVELDLRPADADVESVGRFLVAVRLERVRVSRASTRCAPSARVTSPAQVKVKVGGPVTATALIHLVKLPGKLNVDTRRRGRGDLRRRRALGKVPGSVDVPAGDRTLTFKAPRYLDHVERMTIVGGGEKQELKVALKPNFGVVTVSSVPAGAQIEVDGKPAGVTPAKVEMDSGIRRVQLTAPGLRLWTSSIVVTAGQPANIGPITLGAADAHVTVRSVPSGAQVTTGGSFRGITPVTIDLSPGVSHAITVARAGYAPWTREVFAEPDKASTLDARLAALLVDVRIQGTPEDAEVFVNGAVARQGAGRRCSCPRAGIASRCAAKASIPRPPISCSRPGIARTIDFKLVNPKDVAGNSPARITTKSGIRLLIVTGGTYQAGSDRREQGRRPNEGGHKVTLLRPFYMGEREVTNAQFRQFKDTHNSGSFGNVSLDLDKQAGVARHLERSRGILQLALAAGRPAGRLPGGRGRRVLADHAGEQRLPPAHRGRVGVRRARRGRGQAAQISVGPGSARGLRHRELRRRRGRRDC